MCGGGGIVYVDTVRGVWGGGNLLDEAKGMSWVAAWERRRKFQKFLLKTKEKLKF